MNKTIEFIVKNVNRAFELKEQLGKTYNDVIVVHDSEGYHVAADPTNLIKNQH
jgi:hypothetical protein